VLLLRLKRFPQIAQIAEAERAILGAQWDAGVNHIAGPFLAKIDCAQHSYGSLPNSNGNGYEITAPSQRCRQLNDNGKTTNLLTVITGTGCNRQSHINNRLP
jgi:hypothetical protein